MKKWRIEYNKDRKFSPISWWVHKSIDESTQINEWRESKCYKPEFPKKVVLKGFPYLFVKVGEFELEFASSYEVKHCMEILEQKHLPCTKNLICQGSTTYSSFNHWLAIYPSDLQSWKKRQHTVKLLKNTLAELNQSGIRF